MGTEPATTPTMHLVGSVDVAVPPEVVYDLVADVTTIGERSPECVGARWTAGEPGTLGARFAGDNRFRDREWTTECQVVAADRPHRFGWAVLTSTPDTETSVWTYEIEPVAGGCRVTERYELTAPPTPMQKRIADRTEDEAAELLRKWSDKLQAGIDRTLVALRDQAERTSSAR